MGRAHARAYQAISAYEIVGLVSRGSSRETLAAELDTSIKTYSDYQEALRVTNPDLVSINTYPDTHASYIKLALEADCHVFAEKPLALTVEDAQALVDLSIRKGLVMTVGYILRVHPAWTKFVEMTQDLGKPLVMRMNLNQQSSGDTWHTHLQLMKSMSPIVDCGVHYVDIMCQMTKARPISVSAIGARLSEDLIEGMYNYGQLQVRFDDGSVGWYEAGWGPMISENATFIKDVIGPLGSVSIVDPNELTSDDITGHTNTGGILRHHAILNEDNRLTKPDQLITLSEDPSHDELCRLEQLYLLKAINGVIDITQHLNDAINSLKIVLAADESYKTGQTVFF